MKNKIKKKIIMMLLPVVGFIVSFFIIIAACLMALDFFGTNSTDGYVPENEQYAEQYRSVANSFIKSGRGYVSLERILYFYLEDDSLTFSQIYSDNLDSETKKMKPISDVCLMEKYKSFDGCKKDAISESGQVDDEVNKPFNTPIEFNTFTITSFFMEERTVFGKSDVHSAWDMAAPNNTPVVSVCDGEVETVSFTQKQNITNTSAGGGNQIKIKCVIDEDVTYHVLYAHLYPNSAKVKVGDKVKHEQQIAEVGTTGYSTGPHLHFQVIKDGSNVDGMSLLDFTYESELPKTPSLPQYNPNINISPGGYNLP